MPNPKLPRNEADPTGLGPSRRSADSRLIKRMQLAARQIRNLVAALPRQSVAGEDSKALKSEMRKASLIVNKSYSWQVDGFLMDQTMTTIRQILMESLLSGDTSWQRRWWMNAYIDPAYSRGNLDSIYDAQLITRGIDTPSTNAIAILDAEAQLQTQPYLTRLQLVHGRVFEDMAGIVGDSVAQLRRVLTDGMARGLGIRDISGMINDRVGVGLSRARRIARTEINKAYTDAYMQETEELNKNLAEDDYVIREMHVSALAESTRPSHAARHGTIHTSKEQQKWWDTGSNRINCLCTVISVLINLKTGESIQGPLIKRTRERGEVYFRTHGIQQKKAETA
jgi:SPP1 gp7 family putative phage head morphogenesis protein